jgi:two-component system, NarL family, nitrate/nitrite response regulator NarL
MTFLLIMSDRSYLRDAICSFFYVHIPDVNMIVVESADEVSALPGEDLKNLKLVLLHVGERDAGSLEVCADLKEIEATLNGTPTILFGQGSEPSQGVSAIRAGARGCTSAATPGEIVKHALPLVAGGGVFAPPFLYGGISELGLSSVPSAAEPELHRTRREVSRHHEGHEGSREGDADEELAILTDRELEVLKLLGSGLPNKLIAHRLSLKEGTVKVHMRNLMKKLKVRSRTQAALFASRHFEVEGAPEEAAAPKKEQLTL